ncbi:MAG: hypothetical protein KBD64_02675 [Gammaproteobacteria bacterium]|nr:hypothetical protein [Gammaproteobacteria bacterium]
MRQMPSGSTPITGDGILVHSQLDARPISRLPVTTVPEGGSPAITKYLSLSEILEEQPPEKLLPDLGVFSEKLAEILENPSYESNKKLYHRYYTICLLSLIGVIGIFIRFIWCLIDPKGKPDHPGESVRIGTGGFYYLATFGTTFIVAKYNLAILSKLEKSIEKHHKSAMLDYERFRNYFISKHNLEVAFFALIEIIYHLNSIHVPNGEDCAEYTRLGLKAKKYLKKINSEFVIPILCGDLRYFNYTSRDQLVIDLKKFLLSRKFESLTDALIKYLDQCYFDKKRDNVGKVGVRKLNKKFIENINNDLDTQFLILDMLSKIAVTLRKVTRSYIFEHKKKLIQENADPMILQVLRSSMSPQSPSDPLPEYPWEALMLCLAVEIFTLLDEEAPHILFADCEARPEFARLSMPPPQYTRAPRAVSYSRYRACSQTALCRRSASPLPY